MSELSCHARGASFLFPEVHTVIDIGGQDVKVLQIENGVMTNFVMNDKMCIRDRYWGISEEQRKTLDKVDDLKYVEMDNPFNPGEKIVAVPVPKLDTAIIHVQKASPDGTCIIEGDEFHDVDIAVAARKVIVTCDELVSDEYIRRDPTLTRIFGECVDAVVPVSYTHLERPGHLCQRQRPGAPGLCPVGL